MRVLFDPTPDERGTGLTSTATWNNPAMLDAMHMLFGIKEQHEELVSIEVSREGITARIRHQERVPVPPTVRMVTVRSSVSAVPEVGAVRERRKS